MTKDHRKQHIAESLRLLASTHIQAIRQLETTLTILSRELELQEVSWLENVLDLQPHSSPLEPSVRPIADRTTLSIIFQGKSCFLGNTLLFRFFEVLSRQPNRYFSHNELLDEVWGGPRSDATIRNIAKRLRDKLESAGMGDLAASVDGSTPGYYVLLLRPNG